MRRVGYALIVLASCALEPAPRFGERCAMKDECGVDLECVGGRCVPPATTDTRGQTCERPAPFEGAVIAGLWSASREVTVNDANSSTGALTCGEEGRVHTLDVAIPALSTEAGVPLDFIPVELSAQSNHPVSVALLDQGCGALDAHACATAAVGAAPSVVLPSIATGTSYRIAVAVRVDAETDADQSLDVAVHITLRQIPCPAGFIPDGDGCRGFVAVPGPQPRLRHDLVAVSERSAVAIAGRDPDGRTSPVSLFDRRFLMWRHAALHEDFTEPCGAVAASGELFVIAGALDEGVAEVARAGLQGFASYSLRLPHNDIGVDEDCLAVPLSGGDFALVVGASAPFVVARDRTVSTTEHACQFDAACLPGETCVGRFPSSSTGVCLCLEDPCGEGTLRVADEQVEGPAELARLRGAAAVTLPGFTGDAAVLLLGGVHERGGQEPLEYPEPMLYFEREQLWSETTLDLAERTYVDAAIVGDTVVVSGGVDAGGVDVLADGSGSSLVEVLTLGSVDIATANLRVARRDSAVIPYSATEALVIGGRSGQIDGFSGTIHASTEIVDVRTGAVRDGPVLPHGLWGHRAVALGGEALVVGGTASDEESGEERWQEEAYLLIRIPPLAPGETPHALESFLADIGGSSCDDATTIEGSGSLRATTLGHANSFSQDEIDGCAMPADGLDAVFRVALSAGQRLDVEAEPTERDVQMTLAILDSCGDSESHAVQCAIAPTTQAPASASAIAQTNELFVLVSREVPFLDTESSEERPFGFELRWSVEDAP